MARVAVAVLVVSSLAWAVAVAYAAWGGWPHMSLDLSHGDPATQAAHGQAVALHLVSHTAVALVPLALAGALSWILWRRK